MRIREWSSDVGSSDPAPDRLTYGTTAKHSADDSYGKAVSGADRIDHLVNRTARHITAALVPTIEIRTLGAELDHDKPRAMAPVISGYVLGRVMAGQDPAFGQPREYPIGGKRQAIDSLAHELLRRPQRGA